MVALYIEREREIEEILLTDCTDLDNKRVNNNSSNDNIFAVKTHKYFCNIVVF